MSTAFQIAQLRHLYAQMLDGRVRDTAEAARGLLGPAIEALERAGIADLERERDAARAERDAIVREAQQYQPPGSPPPGGPYVLVAFILKTLGDERDAARAEAEQAKNHLAQHEKVDEHEEPHRARLNKLTIDMHDAPPFILQRSVLLIERLNAALDRVMRERGAALSDAAEARAALGEAGRIFDSILCLAAEGPDTIELHDDKPAARRALWKAIRDEASKGIALARRRTGTGQ